MTFDNGKCEIEAKERWGETVVYKEHTLGTANSRTY